VAEAFHLFQTALDERRIEVLRELESAASAKQSALTAYAQRTRDALEKIKHLGEYAEHVTGNGKAAMLEQRLHAIVAQHREATLLNANLDQAVDFDFVAPSFAAVQAALKNGFGYVRTRTDSGNSSGSGGNGCNGLSKQAPIGRPPISSSANNGGLGLSPLMSSSSGLAAGILAAGNGNSFGNGLPLLTNGLHGLLDRQPQHGGKGGGSGGGTLQTPPAAGGGFQLLQDSDLFSKQRVNGNAFSRGVSNGLGPIGDLSSSLGLTTHHANPYEKWSDGGSSGGKMYGSSEVAHAVASAQLAQMAALNGSHHSPSSLPPSSSAADHLHHHPHSHHANHPHPHHQQNALLDLSSKLLNTPMFPPKSQIKRQKMIYHCKFGEFGVLEGQFTEPSGVAVNAQNDIIVADTNNHRIQVSHAFPWHLAWGLSLTMDDSFFADLCRFLTRRDASSSSLASVASAMASCSTQTAWPWSGKVVTLLSLSARPRTRCRFTTNTVSLCANSAPPSCNTRGVSAWTTRAASSLWSARLCA